MKNSKWETVRDLGLTTAVIGTFVGVMSTGLWYMNNPDKLVGPQIITQPIKRKNHTIAEIEGMGYSSYYGFSKNPKEIEFRTDLNPWKVGKYELYWFSTKAKAYDYNEDGIFDRIEKIDPDFPYDLRKLKPIFENIQDSTNVRRNK